MASSGCSLLFLSAFAILSGNSIYGDSGNARTNSPLAIAYVRHSYASKCVSQSGAAYFNGDSWREGRFLMLCYITWFYYTTVTPEACFSWDNNQTTHAAGEKWFEGANAYRCKFIWGGLEIDSAGVNSTFLSPIILVPGSGGSQIWAKLNRTSVPRPWCPRTTTDFFQLWVSPEMAIPGFVDCWVANAKLHFNEKTQRTAPSEGVEFSVPGFGGTETIEYLSGSLHIPATSYLHEFVETAVSDWGYEVGKTIRGAPFDWRKAPNDIPEYFVALKQLVEDAYAVDENRVTLVSHSLGGLHSLYFLHSQSDAWRSKYIKAFVSISTPWAGTAFSTVTFASGYIGDFPTIPILALELREAQRSWPGIAATIGWPPGYAEFEALVVTERRNYTIRDYEQFFNDINYPEGYQIYKSVKEVYDAHIAPATKPPNVETYCLMSTGLPTPKQAIYAKNDFPDFQPHWNYEDGDGIVSARSVSISKAWATQQTQPFHFKQFEQIGHLGIIKDPTVLAYVRSIVVLQT